MKDALFFLGMPAVPHAVFRSDRIKMRILLPEFVPYSPDMGGNGIVGYNDVCSFHQLVVIFYMARPSGKTEQQPEFSQSKAYRLALPFHFFTVLINSQVPVFDNFVVPVLIIQGFHCPEQGGNTCRKKIKGRGVFG